VSPLLAFLFQAASPTVVVQAPAAPDPSRGRPPATILADPAGLFLAACDANGDARVTAAEREACVARTFATAEGAGGGGIGYIAYADWALRWLGDRNALPGPFEVDADGDNRITAAELSRRFAGLAARYDANRDGVLDRSELIVIRAMPPASPPGGAGDRKRRR